MAIFQQLTALFVRPSEITCAASWIAHARAFRECLLVIRLRPARFMLASLSVFPRIVNPLCSMGRCSLGGKLAAHAFQH
jgi:hypothetical protein